MPVTALLVLIADQITKHFAVAGLLEGQSVEVVSWLAPVLQITHVTNTGAAFGLFRGGGSFFIVIAAIVIVAIIVFSRQLQDSPWLMRVALGLQLGGATGNFVDRLRYDGSVIDFIDLNFWPLREWPVFNVADSSLVVGVILLSLLLVDEERRERAQQQVASDG